MFRTCFSCGLEHFINFDDNDDEDYHNNKIEFVPFLYPNSKSFFPSFKFCGFRLLTCLYVRFVSVWFCFTLTSVKLWLIPAVVLNLPVEEKMKRGCKV